MTRTPSALGNKTGKMTTLIGHCEVVAHQVVILGRKTTIPQEMVRKTKTNFTVLFPAINLSVSCTRELWLLRFYLSLRNRDVRWLSKKAEEPFKVLSSFLFEKTGSRIVGFSFLYGQHAELNEKLDCFNSLTLGFRILFKTLRRM